MEETGPEHHIRQRHNGSLDSPVKFSGSCFIPANANSFPANNLNLLHFLLFCITSLFFLKCRRFSYILYPQLPCDIG